MTTSFENLFEKNIPTHGLARKYAREICQDENVLNKFTHRAINVEDRYTLKYSFPDLKKLILIIQNFSIATYNDYYIGQALGDKSKGGTIIINSRKVIDTAKRTGQSLNDRLLNVITHEMVHILDPYIDASHKQRKSDDARTMPEGGINTKDADYIGKQTEVNAFQEALIESIRDSMDRPGFREKLLNALRSSDMELVKFLCYAHDKGVLWKQLGEGDDIDYNKVKESGAYGFMILWANHYPSIMKLLRQRIFTAFFQ